MSHFIVENAINTCYIDSLLMALFYIKSNISNILERDLDNPESLYLQEYINTNFVSKVRENKCIMVDTMNMIRYMCIQNGWILCNDDTNVEKMYDQQDVSEFYLFLMNKFCGPLINLEVTTISDTETKKTSDIQLPYIPLHIPDDVTETKMAKLLNTYLTESKKELVENKEALDIYKIKNIPEFISLSLRRFKDSVDRRYVFVDIPKKIRPFKLSDDPHCEKIIYEFHAAICFIGETIFEGHYYSILYDGSSNKYLLFDDKKVPCLEEIDMSDDEIIYKIQTESVFLIYKSTL